MANVNLLVKEEEEEKIKNALEINDLNEVNINITKK
ncbi:helix-turn-helix domain-containing protein, partial [Salmonella enterica]|nr:helix-turn-helix domain-containing protein [Salmonella enterica]